MCIETHDEDFNDDFDNDSEWNDDEWEIVYEDVIDIDIDSDESFDQWIENTNRPRATFRKAI